jgi:2-polyprenyl-6-methoxyphenol hydroxylase-like FAD-dependent oxidoreductase
LRFGWSEATLFFSQEKQGDKTMADLDAGILIIGGGFSGMAAAIQLRKAGYSVDLVEADANWRSYGAGISLSGATLRAFKTLGIVDAFLAQGQGSDGVDLCAPPGMVVAQLPTPRIAGADIPGGGGIMRPVLAKILAEATRASGASVFLGCTFTKIEQDGQRVEVSFSDGRQKRYSVVLGADGINSKVREAIFPQAPKPKYTGQCVWRMVLPRASDINRPTMWIGMPKIKVGVNPVSATEMYLFVTEDRPTNDKLNPADFPELLKQMLSRIPAPQVQAIRAQITAESKIVYRPLEGLLLPQPWFNERVVLLGDAVHATTPHLASGACIGIEDAIVLSETLQNASSIEEALSAFQSRRWERCRMVVENSLRLGELEVSGGDKEEQTRIMQSSLMALNQAI